MKRLPTSDQRALAVAVLNKPSVLRLIRDYKGGRNVVWSAGRVLERLKIARKVNPPGSLRRQARRILEELCAEGYLTPKRGIRVLSRSGTSGELGFVIAVQ